MCRACAFPAGVFVTEMEPEELEGGEKKQVWKVRKQMRLLEILSGGLPQPSACSC